MRKFVLTIAGVAILTLTAASTASANWGLGYLYSDAPVGVFFGLNEQASIHVGAGFAKYDVTASSALDSSVETEFALAGALLYDIWSGDGWGFGVAPGVAFALASKVGSDAKSDKVVVIHAHLKGHWDPTEWLSFWFGHGLDVEIFSPGDVGDSSFDSTTEFFTSGHNIADLGFTVWMP
jgi:hypothetical protein